MAEKENQIANWVRLCVCRAGSQLKRDEINEHGIVYCINSMKSLYVVFNKEGIRHFSEMFLKVQTELRENFGLEMVPVPSRGTKQNCKKQQSSIRDVKRS